MDFEKEKLKAIAIATRRKQKAELYEIKHSYDKRTLPTHKLITLYLFIVLNIILIYALVAMWHFQDLSNLGLLITDICGQVLTFFIYSKHSTAQNTKGGINFEIAMKDRENEFYENE